MEVTWYGHNCWLIESGTHRLLIDPFLNNNPSSPVKAADVSPTAILISHGHFDHIDDAVSTAQRTKAPVYASYEITTWLGKQGVAEDQLVGMNVGGGVATDFGRATQTLAHHSSSLPDGTYGGAPAGWLVEIDGQRLYFACDTALFIEMKLIGAAGLDLAVVPIGDRFTMGPADSVEATRLLSPRLVTPCHYNTWPIIAQDAAKWADSIRRGTTAEPKIPLPGDKFAV